MAKEFFYVMEPKRLILYENYMRLLCDLIAEYL